MEWYHQELILEGLGEYREIFNRKFVTGFGKIDHLRAFIVLRNINLKNDYNLAVVSSRNMGLALEI